MHEEDWDKNVVILVFRVDSLFANEAEKERC